MSFPTPQFKSVNSSVLSFFIIQLSHPYMITGKTIALTRWTFVGKIMSLLFPLKYDELIQNDTTNYLELPLDNLIDGGTSEDTVQFSCSVMSDSLRDYELEHTRPPCPSPTPGVHSNSHPSSQ